MMSKNNEVLVKRFSKAVIIAHWMNAIAFFALFLTALPMYTEFFNWLYPILGGPASARMLHRIFAVMFILPTFFIILVDPKSFFHWIKQVFTWKKEDFKFFVPFAKEFFGKKVDVPKQGFYNVGEKLNSILLIAATVIIIGSGVMMWAPDAFPKALVLWAYPLHGISVTLATALVIGHIYLSIGHPNSRHALRGITKGDVPLEYAKHHHGLWYEELQEEGASKPQMQQGESLGV